MPFRYQLSKSFFDRLGFKDYAGDMYYDSKFQNGKLVNPISHFMNYNPIYIFRGLSILVSMLNDIEILYRGRKWNRSLLQNEGRPSGVFFYPPQSHKALNPGGGFVGRSKVEKEVLARFSGADNAGKALVLKGGLQFKEISYSMKDADFIGGLKFSRESIANRFGIPLQLFGFQEKSSYNNMKEAKVQFMFQTCIPFMSSFLEFLSISVLQPKGILGENEVLAIDIDKTEAANILKQEKMMELEKVHFLTPNEKREACGYERVTDMNADSLLVPSTLTPIEDLGLGQEEGGFGDDGDGEDGDGDDEGNDGDDGNNDEGDDGDDEGAE